MKLDKSEIQRRVNGIEESLQAVEAIPDESMRARVLELVRHLMDLHGAGLYRMMEIASESGEAGVALIDTYSRDELVSHLLLLYGLHPSDLETRVVQALERVRPYLQSHGGNVDLLGIDDGSVRLRLRGSCNGCSSSTLTLKSTIEAAIYDAAPDVNGIVVEDPAEPIATGFVPLDVLTAK